MFIKLKYGHIAQKKSNVDRNANIIKGTCLFRRSLMGNSFIPSAFGGSLRALGIS